MTSKFLLALDLDGTLINTHEALKYSYCKALEEMQIEINNLDFLQHGLSFNQICKEIGFNDDKSRVALRNLKDKFYFQNLSLTRVNEPVFNLMKNVSKSSEIGIVTNARKISAQKLLKYHKMIKYVDYLITSDDVSNDKPDPEPYLKLLEISGCDSSEVLAIEDSENGKISAIKAQIKTLFIID